MSIQPHSKEDARQGYVVAFLVIVVSLGFGLFGLPRFGKQKPHQHSPLVGQPAQDFMLDTISGESAGKMLRLSDAQGKVVLLDFFASWCAPCREQAPIVDRVARRLAGPGLAVYGVDTSDHRSDADHYLEDHRPSYPVLFDGDAQGATAFEVNGLPTLVVIDKGGIVRAVETGVMSETELERLLKEVQGG